MVTICVFTVILSIGARRNKIGRLGRPHYNKAGWPY